MTFSVVLLLAGVGLLLIGLLGKIKIKDFDLVSESIRIRIVLSIIGTALLLGAIFTYLSDKPTRSDNSNVTNTNTQPPPTNSNSPTATPDNSPASTPVQNPPLPKPDKLIEIILKEQRDNVRESYGELAGQNFTAKDLEDFKKAGTPANITARLKTDAEFLEIVLAIKQMPPTERQKLLLRGVNTFKPTWEQLGRIDRAGQSKAGQMAERMIAEAIVNLVKELSKLSDEEIRKLQV